MAQERDRHISLKVKLGAPILAAFAVSSCFGGGKDNKQTPAAGEASSTASSRLTPGSTALSTETRTAAPTSTFTPSPTATREPTLTPTSTPSPTPTSAPGENLAAHFPDGLLGNWIEVPDSGEFHSLSEFTILARVKASGIPSDAIVSKGDTVEAFAFFSSLLFSCPGGEMTLVVDNTGYCSNLKIPRGRYVNVGVTFKDGGARFFVDEAQSLEVAVSKRVPSEKGPLFIGASPRGLNEGFSGDIDSLTFVGKALSPDEVRSGFTVLQSQNTGKFLVSNGETIAMWTFDGKNELNDVSGNGHNGRVHGQVTLVPVK